MLVNEGALSRMFDFNRQPAVSLGSPFFFFFFFCKCISVCVLVHMFNIFSLEKESFPVFMRGVCVCACARACVRLCACLWLPV